MAKLMSLAITLSIVASAAVASADGPTYFNQKRSPRLLPVTAGRFLPRYVAHTAIIALPPAPGVDGGTVPKPTPEAGGGPGGAMFGCVVYEDLDNIHPCAVSKVVSIVDPCWKPDPCSCCKPKPRRVNVRICVPPCGCAKVRVSDGGRKVTYDYGEYEIEIESKNGKVYVDYDN